MERKKKKKQIQIQTQIHTPTKRERSKSGFGFRSCCSSPRSESGFLVFSGEKIEGFIVKKLKNEDSPSS